MEIKKCKCGKEFPQFKTTDTKCYKCKLDKERERAQKRVTLPSKTRAPKGSNYRRDQKMEAWHEAGRRRTGGRCEICRRIFPSSELTGDHLLTRGSFPEFKYDPDNQVMVCFDDHEKRHRGLISFKTHPVYKPKYDIMMSKVANAKG